MTKDEESTEGSRSRFALSSFVAMLKQWRRVTIMTTVIGLILSAVISFQLPHIYRSSSLLIVDSPQLSAELTKDSQGAGEAMDRRIARISQIILSRPNLEALIAKHKLYGVKGTQPVPGTAVSMRKAIVLDPAMTDLPGSLAAQPTLAIRLSYDYSDPVKAQAVAQDLVQNILNMDASNNAQQANNTVEFLSNQAKTLEAQISEIQGKIMAVSGANGRVLASQGMTMLGGAGGNYDVQIAALQRDTAALIAQKEASRNMEGRDPGVAAAEAQLAAARSIYTESHPDVILAKQRLAQARQFARSVATSAAGESIDNQIAFNNSQIMSLRAAKGQEQAQISSNLSAMSRAPKVQQEIAQLQQQLVGLNSQYQNISSRLLAARAGIKGGAEGVAERLSVAEPPALPKVPSSPNRKLIVMLGTVAGLALGIAIAFLFEMLLKPVRSPADLAALTGSEPLGVIPTIRPVDAPKLRWSFSPVAFWAGLRSDVARILGRYSW